MSLQFAPRIPLVFALTRFWAPCQFLIFSCKTVQVRNALFLLPIKDWIRSDIHARATFSQIEQRHLSAANAFVLVFKASRARRTISYWKTKHGRMSCTPQISNNSNATAALVLVLFQEQILWCGLLFCNFLSDPVENCNLQFCSCIKNIGSQTQKQIINSLPVLGIRVAQWTYTMFGSFGHLTRRQFSTYN